MVFNGAQFHLLVNHLPVVGFVFIVFALIAAILSKSIDLKRFVLLSTVVVGLSALAPFWTGESAEETIEDRAGFDKHLVHEHEELAEKATVVSVITAILAAFVYWRQRSKADFLDSGLKVVFIFALISAAIMGAAAHEGGKIQHPEILSSVSGS
jgi:cytochrome bd-type quinol oxidase subunit 1